MAPPFLVVVTGLLAEARVAGQPAVWTVVAGGDATRLEADLGRALSAGAGAVLSFGLAAGLQPGRAAGTVVVPDEVIGAGVRYATHAGWSGRLRAALGDADARPLAGVDAPPSCGNAGSSVCSMRCRMIRCRTSSVSASVGANCV